MSLPKKNKTFAVNNESYKSVDDNNALQNFVCHIYKYT